MKRLSQKMKRAAMRYILLQDRSVHPEGTMHRGAKWYPLEILPCCEQIRTPSHGYPWSLMLHCRTIVHVAQEMGYSVQDLKWGIKRLREEI
jgi:hypothetical protein